MDKTILLFDGVCNLCNSTIQFILKTEKNQKIHFASLQSDFVINLLKNLKFNQNIDSILLIKNNRVYSKSSAFFEIIKELKFPWSTLIIFKIFPKFIRDYVYDIVARSRYSIFGKSEHCFLPDAQLNSRFLDIEKVV